MTKILNMVIIPRLEMIAHPPRKWLRPADPRSHQKQLQPAAFRAAPRVVVIGSDSADTGWDQKWRLQQLIFQGSGSVLGGGGGRASLGVGVPPWPPCIRAGPQHPAPALATPPSPCSTSSRRPEGLEGGESGTTETSRGPPSRAPPGCSERVHPGHRQPPPAVSSAGDEKGWTATSLFPVSSDHCVSSAARTSREGDG